MAERNEMKWHEFGYTCPVCKVPSTIEQVSFAANGKVLFEGYCPKCKSPLWYETSAEQQALAAQRKDSAPVTAFTDTDLAYLMEQHITTEETA